MSVNPWLQSGVSAAQEAALITLIDFPVSFAIGVYLRAPTIDVVGFLLLLEAVAMMLVGGALEFGGTASARRLFSILERTFFHRGNFEWSAKEFKKTQVKGAVYTFTGILFFVEALALALLTT